MAEVLSGSRSVAQKQDGFSIVSILTPFRSVSPSVVVRVTVLLVLGAWIGMSYWNGGMFLKEAVFSSLIIGGALINRK